jgi:hypothetical protein
MTHEVSHSTGVDAEREHDRERPTLPVPGIDHEIASAWERARARNDQRRRRHTAPALVVALALLGACAPGAAPASLEEVFTADVDIVTECDGGIDVGYTHYPVLVVVAENMGAGPSVAILDAIDQWNAAMGAELFEASSTRTAGVASACPRA